MLVILDSSMLMLPLEKSINLTMEIKRLISQAHEIVVPKIIVEELKTLLDSVSTNLTRKAQFALNLVDSFTILDSLTECHADDEIERLAVQNKAVVATNDSDLRQKLIDKGIAVISLHGKNRLSLFGYL